MIVLNLIYILNIITLLYFIKLLFISCFYKSTNINKYKIIDKNLSAIIFISYIFIIIIGLYIYRVFNIGNILDLKLLKINYNTLILLDIPLIFKIYFLFHGCLLFLSLILLFFNLHKIASLEIFKIYIFMNYNSFFIFNKFTKKLYNFAQEISRENIISFLINKFIYYILLFLKDLEISHGVTYPQFVLPKYKFSNCIWFITDHRFFGLKHLYTFDMFLYYFMPLMLIIYECLFNNYEITFIFYYLPFIIPIMLLQKITKTIGHTDHNITDLLWEIYYKKENIIYACTKEQKILLDIYLKNGLQKLLGLDTVFLSENLFMLNHSPLRFRPIVQENDLKFYQNDFGDDAQKLPNGDFMIVTNYLSEDFIKKYGGEEKPFINYGEKLIILKEKNEFLQENDIKSPHLYNEKGKEIDYES